MFKSFQYTKNWLSCSAIWPVWPRCFAGRCAKWEGAKDRRGKENILTGSMRLLGLFLCVLGWWLLGLFMCVLGWWLLICQSELRFKFDGCQGGIEGLKRVVLLTKKKGLWISEEKMEGKVLQTLGDAWT